MVEATDEAVRELGALLSAELAAFDAALAECTDEAALYELQVRFIGKKGSVSQLRRNMGKLPPEARKDFGRRFNEAKGQVESGLANRRSELAEIQRRSDLARRVDLSFLGQDTRGGGSLHPITQTRRDLEAIFEQMGFRVAEGPHVEAGEFNFDKLNIATDHPARDMADTFFVKPNPDADYGEGEAPELVLRTHTSPVQIRTMLAHRDGDPPIRIVAPGTVFRRDDDATHSPMFNQIEGLYVDEGVTMADLKATLYRFVGAFFGRQLEVRFRPSYFPFVEPGAEFDVECPFCGGANVSCSVCRGSGWIELGGSGMVHPAVFEACGIDAERYTGWAFGFGIDRMAMMRYGVDHLRHFFEGDLRFLEQFPC